mgnify:CR=1 FL=1
MSISYSAVVLDETTRSNLLGMLGDLIPGGWEIVAHHMTITMGPLRHPKGKHDFSETYPLGAKVSMMVTDFGVSDLA